MGYFTPEEKESATSDKFNSNTGHLRDFDFAEGATKLPFPTSWPDVARA